MNRCNACAEHPHATTTCLTRTKFFPSASSHVPQYFTQQRLFFSVILWSLSGRRKTTKKIIKLIQFHGFENQSQGELEKDFIYS